MSDKPFVGADEPPARPYIVRGGADEPPARPYIVRLGLIAAAAILFGLAVEVIAGGRLSVTPLSAAWLIGLVALALLMVITAGWRTLPRGAAWWVPVSMTAALLTTGYLQWVNDSPLFWTHTDNEMIAEYAVDVLQRGENPYTWDYTDMTRVYRDRGNKTTQFLDNHTQHRVTYPAFPTLMLAAFDVIGIETVRAVMVLFMVALVWLMFVAVPGAYRPLVVLPLFISKDFWWLGFVGAQDVVWSVLLVGVVVAWERPWLRSVLYALAANFRQQPWFIAPFLLILMWREPAPRTERLRKMAIFVGVSAVSLLLFNLPFIIWDPAAWALGALEPVYARFNVVSQGFAALTHYGLLPLPRTAYSALQFAAYGTALWVYWRHTRTLLAVVWVLPVLYFWPYYRGLGNYWLYWLPPLIVAALRWHGAAAPRIDAPPARPLRTLSAALPIWVIVAAFMMLSVGSRQLTVEVVPPIQLANLEPPRVNIMTVAVENRTRAPVVPRFTVQHERVTENYPWDIDTGPEWLGPDESALYTLNASGNLSKAFDWERGSQVVLSDAAGSYVQRAVADVPLHTGPVVNGDYWFWQGGAPYGWTLHAPPGTPLALERVKGEWGLRLGAPQPSGSVRLSQSMPYPQALTVRVNPPPRGRYAVEIRQGDARLWVRFSDNAANLPANALHIPAPVGVWSSHTLDVLALAGEAGVSFTLGDDVIVAWVVPSGAVVGPVSAAVDPVAAALRHAQQTNSEKRP